MRTSLLGPRLSAHGDRHPVEECLCGSFIKILVDADVLTHLVRPLLHVVAALNLYRPDVNYFIFNY